MITFSRALAASLSLIIASGCSQLAGRPSNISTDKSVSALEELRARHEIENLQARYLEIVDLMENQRSGRPSAASAVDELFTPDATWILYADGRVITAEASFKGRAELVELMTQLEARYAPGVYIKHVTTNTQINVAGSTARLTDQLLMLVSDKNKHIANWYVGRYEDTLERDVNGAWKFKLKTLRMEDLTHWASLREPELQ